MTAEELVARFEHVKKTTGGYLVRCPAHDDHDPSLSIREGSDGRVLLHCFAGCTFEAIVAALRLDPADLFPTRSTGARRHGRR